MTVSWRTGAGGHTAVAWLGTLSGLFGAYCYQAGSFLRPIAHSVGLWVFIAVVAAIGLPLGLAARHAVVVLLCAVFAFYVGRAVVFGNYSLAFEDIALWSVGAVVIGVLLGIAAAGMESGGWGGPVACAAVSGLLLGDSTERLMTYSGVDVAEVMSVTFALVIPVLGRLSGLSWARFALLLVPMTGAGWALVSLPDQLEEFLIHVSLGIICRYCFV